MAKLGFIGTGGMGSGMAANLLKAGHSLVINDLRREQGKALEDRGAVFKESPKAVAESCDMVLSMLPYNEAVRAVGLGNAGLSEARSGAKLWVDLSSIDKKTIVEVNSELCQTGLDHSRRFRRRSRRSRCRRDFVTVDFWIENAVRRASAGV